MSRVPSSAILLMLLSTALIPGGDTAGKWLAAQGVSPLFTGWSRFVIGATAALGWLLLSGQSLHLALYRDPRVWFRASLIAGGISMILTAVSKIPMADAIGAFFIAPVVSYILSALLLREPVTLARSLLLAVGFLGMLLVVRPGGSMEEGHLWALGAGVFYGSFLTASRWLGGVAPAGPLLLSQLAIGSVLLTLPGLLAWPAPDLWAETEGLTIGLMISSLASMLGNLVLILAYQRAQASRLAPLVYIQLVFAAFYGWAVFGDWPDPVALAGLALLIGSGLLGLALRR